MLIIPREKLIIRDRQRKQIAPAPLNELKESIKRLVLLHPPGVFPLAGDQYLLIVGERRTRAIDELAKEGTPFKCHDQVIAPGQFPCNIVNLASDPEQKEAELEENIIRIDISWQERSEAIAEIHKLRSENNFRHTVSDTSKELVAKGGVGGATTESGVRRLVRESLVLADNLHKPEIAKARTANEAFGLIMKQEEERVNAIIAKRRLSISPTASDIQVRNADATELLPVLEAGQFDLILGDPPYGINAGTGGFRGRTVHHHNYEDTPDAARALLQCFLTEGFRLTKPRANLFLFTDISHWDWLQRVSAQIGWTPFRRPLIWGKSDSEGLAPWGSQGPRITTEFIFFATKGQKGLLASPIDYLRVNRVPRHERIHAAEKPVELLRKLIECSTLPGDWVLDPCCGSGSTLVACKELSRRALGIEKDPAYFNTAMSNIYMKDNTEATNA
jgi:site-specific DNA-methyltransferase (adenine-specific)